MRLVPSVGNSVWVPELLMALAVVFYKLLSRAGTRGNVPGGFTCATAFHEHWTAQGQTWILILTTTSHHYSQKVSHSQRTAHGPPPGGPRWGADLKNLG